MSLQHTTQTTPLPDVVDFGVGQPGLGLLPLALLLVEGVARLHRALSAHG
jgi:hypothetical protein